MTSPARLAAALRAHAQGLYCPEAAAELLIAGPGCTEPTSPASSSTSVGAWPTGQGWSPSTGRPRSPPWEPACLAPAASSEC